MRTSQPEPRPTTSARGPSGYVEKKPSPATTSRSAAACSGYAGGVASSGRIGIGPRVYRGWPATRVTMVAYAGKVDDPTQTGDATVPGDDRWLDAPEQLGTLGRYVLRRLVSSGGMGLVFEA